MSKSRRSRSSQPSSDVSGAELSSALSDVAGSGRRVRLHLRDGEVVVARVLQIDGERLLYAVVQSSHPERYAVCDSVGTEVSVRDVMRARLLDASAS